MTAALDLRVAFAMLQDSFGIPGIVTRPAPDNTPVSTTVIWLQSPDESQPYGRDLGHVDTKRILSMPRTADLPTAPRGTVIVAAEIDGGETKTWRVESYAGPVRVDEMRVFVTER